MLISLKRQLSDLGEQLLDCRVLCQISSQNERIHEQTNDIF